MKFINTFTHDKRSKIFTGVLTVLIVYMMVTYVITLFAFISPSQDQRWSSSVTSISPSTIRRGDTVTFTAFYEEGLEYKFKDLYYYFFSSEDVHCIFIVLDPNNKPIFMDDEPVTGQGNIEIPGINFVIPNDAALGEYTIRVFVWTDWLPEGESRTYTIEEAKFSVVV